MKRGLIAIALALLLQGCISDTWVAPDERQQLAISIAWEVFEETRGEVDCGVAAPENVRVSYVWDAPAKCASTSSRTIACSFLGSVSFEDVQTRALFYVDRDLQEYYKASILIHESYHILRFCKTGDSDPFHWDTELWTTLLQEGYRRFGEETHE